jgi:hypothetical protein
MNLKIDVQLYIHHHTLKYKESFIESIVIERAKCNLILIRLTEKCVEFAPERL